MSEFCELCAPPGETRFPYHAGETIREPGKCYCGKPLPFSPPPHGLGGSPRAFSFREPGCMDFYEQPQRVDELAARISRIENENREWRLAVSRASLTALPPVFTPASWLSSHAESVLHLIDRKDAAIRRAATMQELLYAVLRKAADYKGEYEEEALIAAANKFLERGPRCCVCGKPCDRKAEKLSTLPKEVCSGSCYCHEECQSKERVKYFLALNDGVKEALFKR